MNAQEVNRAHILQQVSDHQLTQTKAAAILHLTDRQIRRLMVKYRAHGAAGLAHAARGKPSNHRLDPAVVSRALELVRTKYPDFGPTLAAEKLAQRDGLTINHESLRKAMVTAGLWRPKTRQAVHRTRRERRPCVGELEQFDGCRHDWFEGRLPDGQWATLLASRDDADNTVRARFVAYEGTGPVMTFWRDYIRQYGKPQSIYLDRHSTYKVNAKTALDDEQMLSQFERACQELHIEVIHAHSPQAKGRIENLFGTFQDRLVKELRLAGIASVDGANRFLEDVFLPDYNRRFCVVPAESANVHQPSPAGEDLDAVLSVQHQRLINQDFTIRFKTRWLQLAKVQPTLVLPGKRVTIEERLDGSIRVRLPQRPDAQSASCTYLVFAQLAERPQRIGAHTTQPVALTSNPGNPAQTSHGTSSEPERQKPRPVTVPAPGHPWRQFTMPPRKAMATKV